MTVVTANKNRNLQILRGVAILLVAVFHFTWRWRESYPWGKYVGAPWWFMLTHGVQLFFIVSGFVIYQSLNHTRTFASFFLKRINRLVVPLLLIAPLLYLFQVLTPNEVFSKVSPDRIITSILMINPSYLLFFFEIKSDFIAGVQWTLTYEITFYLISSFIFFKISKRFTFEIMVLLTNLLLIANNFYLYVSDQIGKGYFLKNVDKPSVEFVIQQSGLLHLSWFVLGMWFFKYKSYLDKKNKLSLFFFTNLTFLCIYDIAQGRAAFDQIEQAVFSIFMLSLFIVAFFFVNKENLLSKFNFFPKVLEKLGNVSYEFYLIHEILGVTILLYISKIHWISTNPLIFPLVLLLLITLIYLVSILIYKFYSIPFQEYIKRFLKI
jgi:peptidoglycan/LPS O-acetylase OafA/YrhL